MSAPAPTHPSAHGEPRYGTYAPPSSRPQPMGRARPANPAVRALITILGLLVLVTSVGWFTANAAVSAPRWTPTEMGDTVSLEGVREVVIEARRADVTVTGDAGSELVWSGLVHGNPRHIQQTTAAQSGDQLRISPEAPRPAILSGFQWGWGGEEKGVLDVAVPTDPALDLRIQTGVGSATVGGVWNHASVDTGIGTVTLSGRSHSLDLTTGIGTVRGTVSVDGGPLTIHGGIGDVALTLSGAVPSAIQIDGGIGDIALNLPATTHGYVLAGSAGLGGRTNLAPPPDPDGIEVPGPIRVAVNAGIGDVVLGSSAS